MIFLANLARLQSGDVQYTMTRPYFSPVKDGVFLSCMNTVSGLMGPSHPNLDLPGSYMVQ